MVVLSYANRFVDLIDESNLFELGWVVNFYEIHKFYSPIKSVSFAVNLNSIPSPFFQLV